MRKLKIIFGVIASLNILSCLIVVLLLSMNMDAASMLSLNLLLTASQILSIAMLFIAQTWYINNKISDIIDYSEEE